MPIPMNKLNGFNLEPLSGFTFDKPHPHLSYPVMRV